MNLYWCICWDWLGLLNMGMRRDRDERSNWLGSAFRWTSILALPHPQIHEHRQKQRAKSVEGISTAIQEKALQNFAWWRQGGA